MQHSLHCETHKAAVHCVRHKAIVRHIDDMLRNHHVPHSKISPAHPRRVIRCIVHIAAWHRYRSAGLGARSDPNDAVMIVMVMLMVMWDRLVGGGGRDRSTCLPSPLAEVIYGVRALRPQLAWSQAGTEHGAVFVNSERVCVQGCDEGVSELPASSLHREWAFGS